MNDAGPAGTLAAEYLPDLRGLAADQRATFRIGQIVRLSVAMERTAREVHARLQRVPPSDLQPGHHLFAPLLVETRKALEASDFALAPDALLLLDDVSDIYRQRNRFVHDQLAQTALGRWERKSLESLLQPRHDVAVDEAALREAVLDLVRAQWRLQALDVLVAGWIKADIGAQSCEEALIQDKWISVLRGRFELSHGGGVSLAP